MVKGGFSGQRCVIKDSLSTIPALSVIECENLVSHKCTRYRRAILILACMTEYFCVTFCYFKANFYFFLNRLLGVLITVHISLTQNLFSILKLFSHSLTLC